MYFCDVWVYGNVKGHSAGRSGNQILALELFCICLHTIQTNFPSHSSHVWLPVDHEVLAHSQPGKPILPASGPNEAHEPDVIASTYTLSTVARSVGNHHYISQQEVAQQFCWKRLGCFGSSKLAESAMFPGSPKGQSTLGCIRPSTATGNRRGCPLCSMQLHLQHWGQVWVPP